jgi:hypothetical protein
VFASIHEPQTQKEPARESVKSTFAEGLSAFWTAMHLNAAERIVVQSSVYRVGLKSRSCDVAVLVDNWVPLFVTLGSLSLMVGCWPDMDIRVLLNVLVLVLFPVHWHGVHICRGLFWHLIIQSLWCAICA